MKARILKLVNNERTNVRIASKKGYLGPCTGGAYDWCQSSSADKAYCGTYAYDYCSKQDYAACQEGADDTCSIDRTACIGPGQEDNT